MNHPMLNHIHIVRPAKRTNHGRRDRLYQLGLDGSTSGTKQRIGQLDSFARHMDLIVFVLSCSGDSAARDGMRQSGGQEGDDA